MVYLLDTANLNDIKRAFDLYPMAGVTTNPSIIAKEKKDFITILKDIRKVIGSDMMLHAQAVGTKAEDIIDEAKYINEEIGGNFYIKIPVIKEGIKAIKILSRSGIKVTATAVFTPEQALMAAVSGASFVAPYVNRLDNISGDGVRVVDEIVELLSLNKLNCNVLAASFKNVEQVHKVNLTGAQAITVSPEILDGLINHPLTDWSVDKFIKDFEGVYGKGKLTTYNR